MNRYRSHVYVIPEDDRNRQIADGFILHDQVNDMRIQVIPPAGGWSRVIEVFCDEYISKLRGYEEAHVVMLIDFDNRIEQRLARLAQDIPDELKDRVFVVGSRDEPETVKQALNMSYEEIGRALAEDCSANTTQFWDHDQLLHNDSERQRLVQIVRPFLF
jgi:exoribonuclease R